MKILQLISGRDVNGALVHCKLLSQQLCQMGHEVTLMCRRDSWIWEHLDSEGIRVVDTNFNRWPLPELFRTAGWIKRQQFDVIHTHMSRAHTYGVLIRWLTGIPVVATAHNRYPQLHWRWNDRVIANSEATRKYHCRVNGVQPDKVNTIHCFIDMSRFDKVPRNARKRMRSRWKLDVDQPVIGVIGDVVQRKGHWYLFQALPNLLRQFPDLHLVVVGRFSRKESYVKRLRRFQLQHDLVGKIHWLGRRNNIHEVMAALDVVVAPSIEEPMGMVPLESMVVGTPVVVSRTGGLVEVVQNQATGLVVPPKDPAAIEQAVARLIQDRGLAERLVATAKATAEQKFSPHLLSRQVEKTLLESSQLRRAA